MSATSGTPSATVTPQLPTVSPTAQFILGAILVVGIGLLALLSKLFNVEFLWAIVASYAVTATAYGVFLLEASTAINSYWKWIAIIILATVGYGLTYVANNYVNGISAIADPAIIAGVVIVIANFALNDAQNYYKFLPDNVINDITLVIGGITVVAAAVENAPAGSVINASTLLAVAVPALLVYLFQKLPSPTPTPAPVPTPPAGAVHQA